MLNFAGGALYPEGSLFCGRRLGADLIAQFSQHLEICGRGDAGGGQHIAGDGGIGAGKETAPPFVGKEAPSSSQADEGIWKKEAEYGHDPAHLVSGQRGQVSQGPVSYTHLDVYKRQRLPRP